ncbi:MAG TPA: M67 family metallopeptidase [Limnochordia bacterium]
MEITSDAYRRMLDHAAATYPHECCGLLAGRDGPNGGRRIERIWPARNLRTDRDRFEIDPHDWLAADRTLRESGLDILGFYHSHPDHPPRPSRFDAERAFPFYTYVIVSVRGGTPIKARAWRFDEVRQRFDEEEIDVAGMK